MPLPVGTILGPYEILAPLGTGGMGEVYRANDCRLDRIVAIKILPANIAADSAAKQRFEREAKTISSLNHPNICDRVERLGNPQNNPQLLRIPDVCKSFYRLRTAR